MPNTHLFFVLLLYSVAVVVASVIGGILPEWIRLTHKKMQLMISFVGGIMLGIAVFHMIPHSLVAVGGEVDETSISRLTWGVMLGLITTFFLLRFFHFHQHGPGDFGIQASDEEQVEDGSHGTHLCCDHNHPSQAHDHGQGKLRWVFVLVGLGLHTLTDGVAMASGALSDAGHDHGTWLPGFGIFLAVVLHKPLDAVTITSLMHPVTTPNKRLLVNIGFALMCPLGAVLFVVGTSVAGAWSQHVAAWGLAFSAGVFLCISLSDLLPEMEFHSHSRVGLTLALLLGIAAAWSIGLLEGEHAHGPIGGQHSHETGEEHDHGHDHSHDHENH